MYCAPPPPPKYDPCKDQPPRFGSVSRAGRWRETEEANKVGTSWKWILAKRIYATIANDVDGSLAKAEAGRLIIQGHQIQRVLWENRPRRRDIINLSLVVVGGVGGGSV